MPDMKDTNFERLKKINANDKIEKKQGQKYLNWAKAWGEFKRLNPDASYEVVKQLDGTPYFSDDFGVMVETKVTVNGETLGMWLPVLDGANNALKKIAYSYKVKHYEGKYPNAKWDGVTYDEKWVEPVSMFDINTATMRCLVKNFAMFGYVLYLYEGEGMPEGDVVNLSQVTEITNLIADHNLMLADMLKVFGIEKLTQLYAVNFDGALQWVEDNKKG